MNLEEKIEVATTVIDQLSGVEKEYDVSGMKIEGRILTFDIAVTVKVPHAASRGFNVIPDDTQFHYCIDVAKLFRKDWPLINWVNAGYESRVLEYRVASIKKRQLEREAREKRVEERDYENYLQLKERFDEK